MSLTRFSVNQVVLMNIVFVVLIIAGIVVMNALPVDVYPDTSLDIATITTLWLGSSSVEVERLVTRKIEEEITEAAGCDRIVSVSQPDASVITVKFREDLTPAEYEAAFDDVRTRLDRVRDLPDDAEEPVLERVTTDEVIPVVQIGVVNQGDVDEMVLRRVALDLKDELKALPGVTRVREVGLRDREVHVLLDKNQLEKHRLSLAQVADVLRVSNLNMPAGYLPTGDTELTLRGVGEVEDPLELGEICVVRSPTGAHVRLRDIAEITESYARAVWAARVNGKPAVILQLAKDRAANSLTVRQAVGDCIDRYLARLDVPGVGIEVQADSTAVISSRLGVLKNNMSMGILLVFFVLWAAMGVRNSALAIVGIPFSFLCAMIFMRLIGVSLNAVSVFSLVLVSGMIVDDAIVVLENIYHHVQAGRPLREAVIVGTDEVLWPVCSSTMTTIVAFLPLLLMSGVLGRFFSIVPKTVTVALLASLFECLTVLPVHYLDWGPRPKRGAGPVASRAVLTANGPPQGWRGLLYRVYDRVLGQVLAYRYLGPVVLAACLLFVWQAQRTLTVEMFPSEFPTFVVDFHNRPGASLEATTREVAHFDAIVESFKPDRVARSSSAIGVLINEDNQRIMRPDVAQMWIDVAAGQGRNADPVKITNDVREALYAYLATHPESTIESIRVWPVRDGPPVGKPVAIRVEHPDYDAAGEVVEKIKDRLRSMPGVHDVTDNLQLGNREVVLRVDDARASELGVTFLDVATALRGARDGLRVGIFKDLIHDEDLDIKVRYADRFVDQLEELADVDVVSAATGANVKLRQVARLNFDQNYTNRYHYDGKRAVEITANVNNEITDAKLVNERILDEFRSRAEGDDKLSIHAGGQFAETQASFGSLRESAVIALGLMYMILAAQFRSYVQPFVVLTAVIFGVMGMVTGLVTNGYPFSVVTGIAMVGLCGVVVNDAIVLIDFINAERASGQSLAAAVRAASHRRLRPILLTTITTVVGLAPMAFGVGGYSKIWSPFAMSMCWGLAFSTVLTLLVIPALYYITEDAKTFLRRLWRDPGEAPDATAAGARLPH